MKTIILTIVMLLAVAFARTVLADELTTFSGSTVAVETFQVVGDKGIIDGSGSGNSTLGAFTYTYHFEVSLSYDGRGTGTALFTFAIGDTWSSKINALGLDSAWAASVSVLAPLLQSSTPLRSLSGSLLVPSSNLFLSAPLNQSPGKPPD